MKSGAGAFGNVFRKLAIPICGRWLFNNLPASKPFLEVIQLIATDWSASVFNSLFKTFLSGCAESWLPHRLSSSCGEQGLLPEVASLVAEFLAGL